MTECRELIITDTGILSVTDITGPASVTKGDIATFTATVTNSGSTGRSINITFYESVGATLISLQGTDTIPPGGTQYMYIDIHTSEWATGNFSVCAKTADETIYTVCKALEIKEVPPVTEAGGSPILILGLAIGALMLMMSKKK